MPQILATEVDHYIERLEQLRVQGEEDLLAGTASLQSQVQQSALEGRATVQEPCATKCPWSPRHSFSFKKCCPPPTHSPQVSALEDERDGLSQRIRFLERQILSMRENSRK